MIQYHKNKYAIMGTTLNESNCLTVPLMIFEAGIPNDEERKKVVN